MPLRVWAKRRVARELGSATVHADSGWWSADPIAGLVIAAVAANEGREAWRGSDDCCQSDGRATL